MMSLACEAVGHIYFSFADGPQENADHTFLGILCNAIVMIDDTEQYQRMHCDCFWRRHGKTCRWQFARTMEPQQGSDTKCVLGYEELNRMMCVGDGLVLCK